MTGLRTEVAKGVFWLAGKTRHIKTWQREYRFVKSWKRPRPFEPMERRWGTWSGSVWLLELAERIDPEHFDHWAFKYDHCQGERCRRCASCGGFYEIDEKLADKMEDLVELWHDWPNDDAWPIEGDGSLIAFLKMTREQYSRWVQDGNDVDPDAQERILALWIQLCGPGGRGNDETVWDTQDS